MNNMDNTSSLDIRISSDSKLDKYPAKQHARNVVKFAGKSRGMVYLKAQEIIFFEGSDETIKFRQRREFYYLTGVSDIPECHVTYWIEQDALTLWLPRPGAMDFLWEGDALSAEECRYLYDVDAVFYEDRLKDYLQSFFKIAADPILYATHGKYPADLPGLVDDTSLPWWISSCRTIKDTHEIALIRRANAVSTHAHTAVLQSISRLKTEREIEAIFVQQSIAHGSRTQAYDPIAGSGRNCAILHYTRNNQSLKGRQLALVDAGAEWECYASDVTRTFPISGTFTTEARAIYDAVYKVQTMCIDGIKAGVYFTTLARLASKTIIEELAKLGILKGTLEQLQAVGASSVFMPHGLGHHLGLDTHDHFPDTIPSVCGSKQERGAAIMDTDSFNAAFTTPLKAGMVITVEPGIYFREPWVAMRIAQAPKLLEHIDMDVMERYWDVGGVRIEDDVLVTHDGCENLTTAPKEAGEIEMLIQGTGAASCRCDLAECDS